jgi:hypothetical protein
MKNICKADNENNKKAGCQPHGDALPRFISKIKMARMVK